jgi:hypothetical protein
MRILIPLPVLIVTVLSVGGHHAKPTQIRNGVVKVSRHGKVVATSKEGMLRVRLAPGRYTLSASLRHGRTCEVKTVELKHKEIDRVKLYCQAK